MKPRLFTLLFACCLLFAVFSAFAQTPQRDIRLRNCAIYGRVTANSQPAANAQVTATEIPQSRAAQSAIRIAGDGSLARTVYKTRADADGRYQFTGLPSGRFQVKVSARAFISAENDLDRELGRTITLDDGETREKVDFALVRGGVITGRIFDAEGRSPIAHPVHLFRVEPDGGLTNVDGNDGYDFIRTDDRGIYRAYGLRPGNYVISAGDSNYFDRLSGIRKYQRTFHPDARTEKQARVIKLNAGEEKTDIDVKLSTGGKSYEATGRVVDGETGKLVANASISCSKVIQDQNNQEAGDGAYDQTDAAGKFRMAGLTPGRYIVRLLGNWEMGVEYYAEGQFFEIADENANGIEIKATSGGVLSGVAIIEGASDPKLKAKLAQVMLFVMIEGETPSQHQATLKPDGTFRVAGIAPGKVRMFPIGMSDPSFQFLRVERGGSEVKDLLTISKGEKINDLRLIFGQGSGVIRGQVQITGRQLPKDWQVSAQARRVGGGGDGIGLNYSFSAILDERRRFTLEGLFTGEYDLRIAAGPINQDSGANLQLPTPVVQKVTITNGAEVQITIQLDLNAKQQKEEQ